ncbi:response regulator transcription factor [Salinisphaera sp.]|uniref:response regulator transcription factor n=1 Tax=Salinisphaera sp. TaxID=1914330 RepID=UPI002D764C01|nr:response regulator [Salinisphaera sp.]HET7313996.1 response regulator [Salinisphaera sp.]
MEPQVHIVDDDDAVRRSLRVLLDSIQLSSIEYPTGRAFVERERDLCPGCVLLDLRIPDMSGLDIQKSLAGEAQHLPVIFMTGYGDIEASVSAMREGAANFLTKPVKPELLLAEVRESIERSREILAEQQHCESVRARMALLTLREADVLKEVVAGWSNKHIARRLGISPKTVELHRANVMNKMHAGSLAELVRLHLTATGEAPSASHNRGPEPRR